jgi:hypothetical protein
MMAADLVAISMARQLADAGLEVRLYLRRGEWTVKAIAADRQIGFGFRVASANLLTSPEGFAELHARKMREDLAAS